MIVYEMQRMRVKIGAAIDYEKDIIHMLNNIL